MRTAEPSEIWSVRAESAVATTEIVAPEAASNLTARYVGFVPANPPLRSRAFV